MEFIFLTIYGSDTSEIVNEISKINIAAKKYFAKKIYGEDVAKFSIIVKLIYSPNPVRKSYLKKEKVCLDGINFIPSIFKEMNLEFTKEFIIDEMISNIDNWKPRRKIDFDFERFKVDIIKFLLKQNNNSKKHQTPNKKQF